MTFEELLNCSANELEKMSDEELLIYLSPRLKNCPPIDIQVIQAFELKEQEKKNKIKQEKKELKSKEKEQNKKDPSKMLESLTKLMVEVKKL